MITKLEALLKDYRSLQRFCLSLITPETVLTVEQARLLDICRVCHGPFETPFIVNYGQEYAHEKCCPDDRSIDTL